MANEVLVVGHRNPDTDSICAAYAYAWCKNQLDCCCHYRAVRCGHLPKQTQFICDSLGVSPPDFIKNVYASVSDAMSLKISSLNHDSPLADVLPQLDDPEIHTTSILDEHGQFAGIVSIREITRLLLSGSESEFDFYPGNWAKSLSGQMLRQGLQTHFRAHLLIGAMPLATFCRHLEKHPPHQTLLLVGNRPDLIEVALARGIAALVISGGDGESLQLAEQSSPSWIFVSDHDTLETKRRLLLSLPVSCIMHSDLPRIQPGDNLQKVRTLFLSSSLRGLPVRSENDQVIGIITRSDLIQPVHKRLILVDHNELSQAVEGAAVAEICEIIDHHRLGATCTAEPITIVASPVGSTCTLVYRQLKLHSLKAPREVAGMLLAGIISDTLVLKSPTTTDEDRQALQELSLISGIDAYEFASAIFAATDGLKSRIPEDVVTSDFKVYHEFGRQVGIGQAEVSGLDELPMARGPLLEALQRVRQGRDLDWTMLLVSDVVHNESVLLTSGYSELEENFKYTQLQDCTFALPGVLSRKKQLLPEVLRVLAENASRG